MLHHMNPEAIKLMLAICDCKQQAEQQRQEQQKLRVLDHQKRIYSHLPRQETEERLVPLVTDKAEFVSDVNRIICAFSDSARNHCVKNKQQQQDQERLVTKFKNKSFPNSNISEPMVTVQDHQDMLVRENDSKTPLVSMSSNDSTRTRKRRIANCTTTSSSSNRSSSLSTSIRKYEEDKDQVLLEEEVSLILSDKNKNTNKHKKSMHSIRSSSSSSSSSSSNLQEESARHQSFFKKKRLLTMRYNQEREEDANLLLSLSFLPSWKHCSTNSDSLID